MIGRALLNHLLLVALFLVFCLLNSKIWFSDNGFQRLRYLEEMNAEQSSANAIRQAENDRMMGEISSLQQDGDMVEYAARADLGMIARGETYFQFAS